MCYVNIEISTLKNIVDEWWIGWHWQDSEIIPESVKKVLTTLKDAGYIFNDMDGTWNNL